MPTNPASASTSPSSVELPSEAANLKISIQSPEGAGVTASTQMTGAHLNRFWETAAVIAAMAAMAIIPLLNAEALVMIPSHLSTIVMVLQATGIVSLYAIWRSRGSR